MFTLVKEVNIIFVLFQGLSTFLVEQHGHLRGLVNTYCGISDITLIRTWFQSNGLRPRGIGAFVVSHCDVELFLTGTGCWVARALDHMDESARDMFVRC